MEKCKNQQRSRINKAFKKIPRFDGTNPSYSFNWLEQTEALVNEHQGRIYREELLLNCGTSISKTIHALPQGATNQHIKDAVLRNHSNLRMVSQRSNAYQQLHQKPDEALQTYNMRYASFFNLHTLNWNWTTHSAGCTAYTMHRRCTANSEMKWQVDSTRI